MLAMFGISLHAVVQFHEDWLQAGVHPLDQFVVDHQRPQQHAQDWKKKKKDNFKEAAFILHRYQSQMQLHQKIG